MSVSHLIRTPNLEYPNNKFKNNYNTPRLISNSVPIKYIICEPSCELSLNDRGIVTRSSDTSSGVTKPEIRSKSTAPLAPYLKKEAMYEYANRSGPEDRNCHYC